MTLPPTHRSTRALLPSLFLAATVLFTACGSDASVETAAVEVGPGAQLGDSGVPSLEEEADEADPSDQEADAGPDDAVEVSPTEEAAVEEYMQCMDEAGVDIDALNASFDQDEIDALVSDPDFIAADRECSPILEDAFGSFELDPATEALLAERSVALAACAREVLGVEIPDDILLLEDDDPRLLELDAIETTPEEDEALEACAEEALGDLIDDDGGLIITEEGE